MTRDIEKLANMLKNCELEHKAERILRKFIEAEDLNEDEIKIELTENNCYECTECSRYFGEDEIADDDLTCIYCYEVAQDD